MRSARLGEVVASMKNGMYKPASEYGDDGLPCLRMYNIDAGGIVWRDIKRMRVTDQEYADYGLHEGDLLVNRVNSRELVGKAAYIPASLEPSVFESKNIRVRLDTSKALPKFINYQLFASGSRHFANNAQQVVGMASISQGQLADFPIVLTSLDEQREIVAELEKQFSRLDEAVANLQRVKANLKRYKASVLKAAVEGRLVETEATLAHREGRTYETGEQLLQRIIEARRKSSKAKRNVALSPLPPRLLPRDIPTGWAWTTTGQLCDCIVPNRDKPKTFTGDIPWLTLPDFDDSEIAVAGSKSGLGFTESEVQLYSAKVIPVDSVVMSCVGRFGISAVLSRRSVINQQLHAFLPNGGHLPRYLAYVLRTREQEMVSRSTATTIAYLNKENCNSITVPLPPLAEQIRIVADVDRHLPIIREVETEVDVYLKRAQALRQSTLTKAFAS